MSETTRPDSWLPLLRRIRPGKERFSSGSPNDGSGDREYARAMAIFCKVRPQIRPSGQDRRRIVDRAGLRTASMPSTSAS